MKLHPVNRMNLGLNIVLYKGNKNIEFVELENDKGVSISLSTEDIGEGYYKIRVTEEDIRKLGESQ